MVYLQVNALSEWIIGIYMHEFTNNEREISISHAAASCGIENFEFIVRERVQLNPDNLRAMSVLTFSLFKLNTLQTEIVRLWVSRSHGVMTVPRAVGEWFTNSFLGFSTNIPSGLSAYNP